jgi:hypothetical protein
VGDEAEEGTENYYYQKPVKSHPNTAASYYERGFRSNTTNSGSSSVANYK